MQVITCESQRVSKSTYMRECGVLRCIASPSVHVTLPGVGLCNQTTDGTAVEICKEKISFVRVHKRFIPATSQLVVNIDYSFVHG